MEDTLLKRCEQKGVEIQIFSWSLTAGLVRVKASFLFPVKEKVKALALMWVMVWLFQK